jgi:Ca2+-binding EF-hand superfamily protein
VLGRVFDNIDQDSNGAITWEEYLAAMDVMFNGTYEQQIDLFFTVYDTDGNGNLSFEEIKNLCKLQLQNSDADNVIEELSHSFATLIFDITETPYDKEIPADKIKQVLTRQTDKSLIEMFCSFSFMKNN